MPTSNLDVVHYDIEEELCADLIDWTREHYDYAERPGATPGESRAVTSWVLYGGSNIVKEARKVIDTLGRAHRVVSGVQWDTVESIEVMRYRRMDHYGPHMDWEPGDKRPRKLTLIAQLTPWIDYGGGAVVVYPQGPDVQPTELSNRRGSAIMFPSFMVHEVKPVTSGERWSLVAWYTGREWR